MTDKTQPTAHAEITTPISADLRGIDDAGAKSAPITLMTEDRACTWAWDQVQQDVGAKGWTAGDYCNFHGFFLWGWNYRGQYEAQRSAATPAPAAVAVPSVGIEEALRAFDAAMEACSDYPDTSGDIDGLVKAVRKARAALAAAPAQAVAWMTPEGDRVVTEATMASARKDGGAMLSSLRPFTVALGRIAFPAQEHATQLAGQGQEPSPPVAVAGPIEWPATCDGLEQEAWEAWARVHRFDMVEHTMHYLFLNERTDAARQGWKGGLVYAVEQMKQRVHVVDAAPVQAQEDARDAVRALIATHAEMLEDNAYAYFELAYTRQTGWMAWITDKPLYGAAVVNPDRKVLANGQGDTPDEACADAARAAQGGDKP